MIPMSSCLTYWSLPMQYPKSDEATERRSDEGKDECVACSSPSSLRTFVALCHKNMPRLNLPLKLLRRHKADLLRVLLLQRIDERQIVHRRGTDRDGHARARHRQRCTA